MFELLLHQKASEFFKKIDKHVKERIVNDLKKLKENPQHGKHLKYSNFWSLRSGDYRSIYEINFKEKRVIVLFIGHRKHVYDDFSKLF